ncbi:hypothetical protein ACEXQB_013400 [Herbiconiux sp. P18]|uniref:hypothetical protein n=1 Tax=Herbiconiux liangxiaofengii TaxID=3342795 RepID=UPI0035B817AA
MIARFLRRPHGAAEWVADAVRVVGLLSVVAAFVGWSVTDAGILALVLPALLVPRFVGVHPLFDVGYGVTLLVAAWSNVFDLYTRVWWWDLVVHFACTGVIAALVYLLLARVGMLAAPGSQGFSLATSLVFCATFGLAGSAVWEMIEWLGKTYVSPAISVEYGDTIGDMTIGGLGAVVAGVLLWASRPMPPTGSRPGVSPG